METVSDRNVCQASFTYTIHCPMSPISCFIFLVLTSNVCLSSHREKRFLLYFPNGGVFKIVFGFAVPVPLGLKQSMGWGLNFQWQYPVAQTTNNTRVFPPIIPRKRRSLFSDRKIAYDAIEALLNSNGLNGRQCLLHAICENAMESLHHEANGLYGQLLHILLTPDYGGSPSDLDPAYFEAEKAGIFGVDCNSLHPNCGKGGILNVISIIDE